MSRRCPITGRGVMTGNNVSHAHNKSRRRFLPNLHEVSLLSEALGTTVNMRVSVKGMRTVEHNGGLDSYVLNTPVRKLTDESIRIRRRVKKALKNKEAVAS